MAKEAKKLNLREKLNDDTLDLSLCELETLPIKEIAELTKVKKLNLSYNKLTTLPDDFCKLQHIKEIDLSKNQLRSLPKNFGFLHNLKTLDLLGNKLVTLPSSFGELKSLQWLDLKDNPLNPALKQAAGDCLDEAQCKKCASNVLKVMKQVAAEEERRRQIELKKQRDEQLKKEAKEREEAEQLRLQKKQEKELRRREINEQRKTQSENQKGKNESEQDQWYNKSFKNVDISQHEAKKGGFFSSLLLFLVRLVLYSIFLGLLFLVINNYCQIPKETKLKSTTFNYPFLKPAYEFVDTKVCPHIKTDILKHPLVNELLKKYKLIASTFSAATKAK